MTEPYDESRIQKLTLKAAVRSRAGMYFGSTGPAAIPCMVRYVIYAIIETIPDTYAGPIRIEIDSANISIYCLGLNSSLFTPADISKWLDLRTATKHHSYLPAIAGGSDKFTIESCDGTQLARLENHDDVPISTSLSSTTDAPFLRISFRPFRPLFDTITTEGVYNIAGILRTLSFLNAGLATSLRADLLPHELHYYYKDGMHSLLFEEDYYRWPLHPGCLSFKATENDMSVEGYLRFLHAGTPHVRTYINFQPSQGGTHLEGLGLALCDLFPQPKRGCREMTLYTNPDSGAKVILPHCMIGALHLQLPNPQYSGPTRDVLANSEARDFVHRAASASLKQQWQALGR